MLSVIIPTWCEAQSITEAVKAARAIGEEVIVVDAQSPDATAELAAGAGARVLLSPKGRGLQLHAGALAARGDAFLFLHADAHLPPTARAAIDDALARVDGGNFHLRFVPDSPAARLFTWSNDLRRRWLDIYYGDSALFVSRAAYQALGGYRPLPIMEDYEFIRRLERLRRTSYIRHIDVRVDARRFEQRPISTLVTWTLVQALFSLGISAERLAPLYGDLRAERSAARLLRRPDKETSRAWIDR